MLKTPAQIQDFINTIPFNFEKQGVTLYSPSQVLRHKKAHCIEGALLAAQLLSKIGYQPLIMDLRVAKNEDRDFDHVVCVFKEKGFWGAISKTNHTVLRYREPVYKTIRELAMSYFHEYFLNTTGEKTLRSYSLPLNLNKFNKKNWQTSNENLWYIANALNKVKHFPILNSTQIKKLRKADAIERKAGAIIEWKKK